MRRHGDLGSTAGSHPKSQRLRRVMGRHFEVVADRLADDNTLMPCGFGLADVLLMSCLDWAIAYGVAYRQHYRVPQLPQHAARLSARDENQLSRFIWGRRMSALVSRSWISPAWCQARGGNDAGGSSGGD